MSGLYRRGVVAIIMNADGKILIGERSDTKNQWQLPQGGIDKGESEEEALHREIHEEVGVKNLKIVKRTSEYIRYDWPEDLKKKKKWKYVGQEHIYFILLGDKVTPEKLTETEEFSKFKWVTVDQLVKHVVDFRKDAYLKALRELKLLK